MFCRYAAFDKSLNVIGIIRGVKKDRNSKLSPKKLNLWDSINYAKFNK